MKCIRLEPGYYEVLNDEDEQVATICFERPSWRVYPCGEFFSEIEESSHRTLAEAKTEIEGWKAGKQ